MTTHIPADIAAAREKLGASNSAMLEGMAEALAPFIAELQQKVAALEAKIGALEDRQKQWTYTGTWREDRVYRVGNWTTAAGSLWHCERDHVGSRPGDGDAWKLGVKRGVDAKGAR
jgi:hypothetical protein